MVIQKNENIEYHYDKDADVLYASLGKPRRGYSEETPNGILVRYDNKTNEVIGFTIYNYSRKLKRGQLMSIPHFPKIELPKVE
jgi:uncharacterized protein YuzE